MSLYDTNPSPEMDVIRKLTLAGGVLVPYIYSTLRKSQQNPSMGGSEAVVVSRCATYTKDATHHFTTAREPASRVALCDS